MAELPNADVTADARGQARLHAPPPARQIGEPGAVSSQITSGARDAAFALGLILSPSSQLRLAGSSLGPGELFLLIWILLGVGRETIRLGPPLTSALCRLLIFWAVFAAALSVGTITATAIRDSHDPALFFHDVMAYALVAAVSCLSALDFGDALRLRRLAWFCVTFGAGSLVLQLSDAWGPAALTASDPWYWQRFRGWSENPAQLAFLCAALGLLSLHLAETAERASEKLAAIILMILPIYVGRLTKTDTFTLVLLVAAGSFIAIKFRTWLRSSERLTLRFTAACVTIVALPLLLVSAAPLAPAIADWGAVLAKTMVKDNGKGAAREAELRLNLWREAWSRGLESGMLGLGPGPHLPIPASIVSGRTTEARAPRNMSHPAMNGTLNYEAHNTLFDLFTQGGLLAVSSFVWLTSMAFLNVFKAGMAGFATLLVGLLCFGMFDMIARYPILWCVIALCLVAAPRPAFAMQNRC